MRRHVLMLRAINLGPSRRVPMAELRTLLADAGYEDVATYVQSGNVVLSADATTATLESDVSALIGERFGFEVPVVGRTAGQLAAVVARDPFGDVADDPKRYHVSFLSKPVSREVRSQLEAACAEDERVAFDDREVYAWTPGGAARSKLWNALGGPGLGVVATARNWTTVTTLARMASRSSA